MNIFCTGNQNKKNFYKTLIQISEIYALQEIVSELVYSRTIRQSIRRLLRSMGDLERLAGRAGAGQASARDLVAIADGLERVPQNLIR